MYNACHITVTLSTIQPSFRGDVEQLDKLLAKMIVPRSLLEVSMQRCSSGWLSAKNLNSFTHVQEYLLVLMHCDFKSPITNQRSYYFLSEASHEVLHFVWLGPWNLQLTQKNKPSSLAQCELISNLLGQPSCQPLHLLLHCHTILISVVLVNYN